MSQSGVNRVGPGSGGIFSVEVDTSTPPGTDPVVPNGTGQITVTGGQVAPGTTANAIQTNSLAANTFTIQVQQASAAASSTPALNGVASFNSADFTVDSGFVSFSGTGSTQTLTGNSGGAVGPTAGNINTLGTGSVTVVGTPLTSTLTYELTGLTNHNVLVGAGTATITKVAPSATSGVPLISQGAAADPAFGTAVVAGGGTGKTSFTAYSVICAGTTATAAFQNVSGLGTTGQVLTSNGAAALPTWQDGSSVLSITSVNNAASPYTVLGTDQFLACQSSTGIISILLPDTTTTGRVIVIKDSNGDCNTNNISVTTVGGTVTVDGQTTYTMNVNYQSISVIFDGTNYEVF